MALAACSGQPGNQLVKAPNQAQPELADEVPQPGQNSIACVLNDILKVGEETKACCANIAGETLCWKGAKQDINKTNDESFTVIERGTEKTGRQPLKIVSYHFLNSLGKGLSVEKYWEYLMENVKNAEELGIFVENIMHYETDDDDRLLSADELLAIGKGDCDNYANVMKKGLILLGKKKGHDYQPKILSSGPAKHSVLAFIDEDNVWKSFDQLVPFNIIEKKGSTLDWQSASKIFKRATKPEDKFYERVHVGKNGTMDISFLDPNTLKHDFTRINIRVWENYDPSNPKEYLPEKLYGPEWVKFKDIQVRYPDTVFFYASGHLDQIDSKDSIQIYEDGKLVQESFNKPKNHVIVEVYSLKTGKVQKRHFEDGTIEAYDETTGIITRRQFANKDLETFKNGQIDQKIYKSGKIDFESYENGHIGQRSFRDGTVEWLDENGKIYQIKDARGTRRVNE